MQNGEFWGLKGDKMPSYPHFHIKNCDMWQFLVSFFINFFDCFSIKI